MARRSVTFTAARTLAAEPATVFDALCDFAGHGEWIPATRVEVDPDEPRCFTAYSGVGPLVLEDRMRATTLDFDGTLGHGEVAKLGPHLVGTASFSLAPGPTPGTTVVSWFESVTVPHLPRLLVAPLAACSSALFAAALGRLGRRLSRQY